MGRRSRPKEWVEIARERINILFREARKAFRVHPERSKRYVELAKKIGMRYNVRIPGSLKRRFCSKCGSYLKQGVNCRTRINRKKQAVAVTCLECGYVSRYPYIREKKNNKQEGK